MRILFLEDNLDDVELMRSELEEASMKFTSVRVDRQQEFSRQVQKFQPSIILADYSLPSFNGMDAFRMIKRKKLGIPFILVTGALSEHVALDCVKEGVDDFILKSSFKRLPAAIKNAIEKKKNESEKVRMALTLKKTNLELQLLTERLHVSREEERLHLARELHDELGQLITALKIDIAVLRKRLITGRLSSLDAVDTEFQSIINLVENATESIRRISSGLRPEILEELGIVEAIRWLCLDFETRNNVSCNACIEVDSLDIDLNSSIALYRMVQEALTNIARHAKATQADVNLSISNATLVLSIQDNGVGISSEDISSSNSLGIIGLRERARFLNGRFTISGRKGKGTKISITVPIMQAYAIQN
ncbi:MAG TPA: response regulator [Cyclobacteriaceae bacterium]|nr:response regulator [Cyclobacteriaceae bacterium]